MVAPLKQYHKNPRRIKEQDFKNLQQWLGELGDLSGVVHDLNSDEIITGNQRGRVFDVGACQIEMISRLDEPDEQGTVGLGFIVWQGKRYNYRQVRWSPGQCEKANIIANKAGGEWDMDLLANEFDLGDLIDWGFDDFDLGMGITAKEQYAIAGEQGQADAVPEQKTFPLAIVLTTTEYERWRAYKERIEAKEDYTAFLVLMGAGGA